MFGLFKKKQKYPYKPPSKKQIEECETVGLVIKPKMSSHDVWQMLNDARENPKYKDAFEAFASKQKQKKLLN